MIRHVTNIFGLKHNIRFSRCPNEMHPDTSWLLRNRQRRRLQHLISITLRPRLSFNGCLSTGINRSSCQGPRYVLQLVFLPWRDQQWPPGAAFVRSAVVWSAFRTKSLSLTADRIWRQHATAPATSYWLPTAAATAGNGLPRPVSTASHRLPWFSAVSWSD